MSGTQGQAAAAELDKRWIALDPEDPHLADAHCNMAVAATAGTLVPLGLKALKVDPALSASLFITTFTDVVGFASFLGLVPVFIKFLSR